MPNFLSSILRNIENASISFFFRLQFYVFDSASVLFPTFLTIFFENLATNLPQLLSLGRSVRAEVSQLCCLNSEYSAQVLTLFAIFKFIRTLPSIDGNRFCRLNSEYHTQFPTLESLIQRPIVNMSLWFIEFCDESESSCYFMEVRKIQFVKDKYFCFQGFHVVRSCNIAGLKLLRSSLPNVNTA